MPQADGSIAPVVVIGLGNMLRSDDGIGPRAAAELATISRPGVEIIDGGIAGLSLLEWIADRLRAIIVDAADMGRDPGTVIRFAPEDVAAIDSVDGISHATGVFDVLKLGAALGPLPAITIYGVQPASVAPGEELTPVGRSALTAVVRQVRAELDACEGE